MRLHAAALVCADRKNDHRHRVRASLQTHPRALAVSQPSSLRLLLQVNTAFRSTKVGSGIHRVRPASGFLLGAQSKAPRRGGFSYNPGLHRVASLPIGH